MTVIPRVQIHQYNDSEILAFFNGSGADFRLLGDHLFVIHSRGRDAAAGPGDWLVVAPDGEVDVEPGDYRRLARIGDAGRDTPAGLSFLGHVSC